MGPAEFHRRLSEASSNEDLLDLYHQLGAERIATELAFRDDEDNRNARRDYARALERHMVVGLSLPNRETLLDPDELVLQARKLEKLRK